MENLTPKKINCIDDFCNNLSILYKDKISNRYSNLSLDEKQKLTSNDFTTSELTLIILETPLTDLDKKIAFYKYVKLMSYKEISDNVNLEVDTVKRHLKVMKKSLRKTMCILF